jgi:glycosyltransferase involved in cell wall biosynthesis
MVYYHVWDNYPYPTFNKPWYASNDHIACISKLTHDIVQTVVPDVESSYIPHAVDEDVFRPLDPENIKQFRESRGIDDKFVCFWNNRNARRKQSGTLIFWFKEFLDKVGHDNATLIMHTDPKDIHGQDLEAIIHELELTDGQVLFSRDKVQPVDLAMVYNMADLTINISDAEGFGLATLESLSSGTPILINKTGGLQDQISDGETSFGIGLDPSSKAIIGSQDVPYIYEDRVNKEDFLDAITKLYEMSPTERVELGAAGRKWTQTQFNFETFTRRWDELFMRIYEEMGSWEERKGYSPYTVKEY